MEDIRYRLTVPAQSVFGQVGCLAGSTIAYRRSAFEPAVERLVRQTAFGIPQHVGDILTPFALYAVAALAVGHTLSGHADATGLPLAIELPLFVLQITFVMVPIRIAAFATMFHQEWGSRGDRPERSRVRSSFLRPEPAQETVMVVPGESSPRVGRYLRMHVANADHRLVESSYDNNAASVLLSLRRCDGVPQLRILALCATSEQCSA